MSAEQAAYLATCAAMVAAGLLLLGLGSGLCKLLDADWPAFFIALGLLCVVVGPVMLIGFPQDVTQ